MLTISASCRTSPCTSRPFSWTPTQRYLEPLRCGSHQSSGDQKKGKLTTAAMALAYSRPELQRPDYGEQSQKVPPVPRPPLKNHATYHLPWQILPRRLLSSCSLEGLQDTGLCLRESSDQGAHNVTTKSGSTAGIRRVPEGFAQSIM